MSLDFIFNKLGLTKKVIVTGGSGFVGSYIIKELGTRAINFDLKIGKDMMVKGIDEVAKEAEAIIHLAIDPIDQEDRTDFEKMQKVMELARKNNLKVVYVSSAAVYKDYDRNTNRETDDIEGLTPYAQSKVDCEYLAASYRGKVRTTILRYFNVYGEGQTPAYAGVITKFLDGLKEGEVSIYGEGGQIRDFIKVEDVAKITVNALGSKWDNLVVNVGTGVPTTINDLYQLFVKLSGKYLKSVTLPARKEIFRSCADNTLLRHLWGQPDPDLEEGIKQLIKNKYG